MLRPLEVRAEGHSVVVDAGQALLALGDRVVLFSPHPGRIREEFKIALPRPRDINSPELAQYSSQITRALKAHRVDGEVSE